MVKCISLMNNYFIKDNYKCNDVILSNVKISGVEYWTSERIYTSSIYQYPVYKYSIKIIKKYNIEQVVDVGCGVATKLAMIHKKMPQVEIVGIDQKNAIDYCKNTYQFGSWYCDDFENPKKVLSGLKADLIICSDVIEHIMNPNVLLTYLKNILSKDGYLILSTPNRDLLRGIECYNSPNKAHIREWNFIEFEKYLDSRGFEILEHFNQFPTAYVIDIKYIKKYLNRIIKGKSLKYNQICLLKNNF